MVAITIAPRGVAGTSRPMSSEERRTTTSGSEGLQAGVRVRVAAKCSIINAG
jgi:hypothetical protein